MNTGTIKERRVYRILNLHEWLKSKAAVSAADAEEFELHLAAHEWSLAEPLDINRKDDFSCLPKIDVDPYEHQVDNAIQFFRCLHPAGMVADDVGLGKTITAGLIAKELLDRGRVESILVVCPKNIMGQWADELQTKFNVVARAAVGGDFANLKSHPFWITSYHTARSKIAAIRDRQFDLLILDEAHALRNLYGTPNPPKTAQVFRDLMREGKVRFCIMLTATPLQNRLWDIYSQFEVLKAPQPNPLGPPDEFARRFIADREARRLLPGTEPEFRRRVSQALIRTRRKDAELLFPEREVRDSRLTPLPEEREYIEHALKVILEFPKLVQYTYARSLMSSPWALAASFENKAREDYMLSPAFRKRLLELAEAGRAITESAKTRAVVEYVKAAAKKGRAERLIVFTMRIETLRFLAKALERTGFKDQIAILQGGQAMANRRAIQDFMAEPPIRPILLSTDVGGVGLNLQAGNVVVNYDLPWNPMVIEQRIGRVQRLGQQARRVIVYNLVLKDTIEDHVVLRLMEKLNLFNQAIGEMEELLELCGYGEEGRSLEEVIMELVRKAAEKKDVSEDLRRMEESRRKAEAKMKEMREATEQALGSIRAADHGRRLAGLKRIKPRLDLRSLIRGCLRRAGTKIRETSDGRLFIASAGRETELVFNPADYHSGSDGHKIRLVMPGTKTFDRITHWVREEASAYILDTRKRGLDKVEATLKEKLKDLGMVLNRLRVAAKEPRLALRAWFRVGATVATDRYETIVEIPIIHTEDGVADLVELSYLDELRRDGDFTLAAPDQLVKMKFSIDPVHVQDLVEKDESINTFCRFYEGRFEDDLLRLAEFVRQKYSGVQEPDSELLVRRIAGTDPSIKTALHSLELRFVPQVEMQPLGICGLVYDRVEVEAFVRNRMQQEAHPVRLTAIPLAGVVSSELPIVGKAVAVGEGWACPGGHIVAASDFEHCSYEGCTNGICKTCRQQSQVASPLSACVSCGRLVCAEHRRVCRQCSGIFCFDHIFPLDEEKSFVCTACSVVLPDGRRVLAEEVRVSAVSGRTGLISEMRRSAVSDQWAFPEEMVQCEASGRLVLPDEVVECAVTGRRVAPDLVEQSAVSGRYALKEYIKTSDWTGKPFIPGEEKICAETGNALLPDEVGVCSVTGRQVRKDLLEKDSVTGKSVLKRIMEPSAVSGRLALPENMVESAYSGRRGLPDEAETCEICGQQVLKDELIVCPETKRKATPDHFERCEFTGDQVLPEGLAICEVTGKKVRRSLLRLCPETGKRALAQLFEKCEHTGIQVLPEGLAVSSVSGRRVRRSLLVPCEETGRLALPQELGICTVTDRRVHPDMLIRCPDTGLTFLQRAGVYCEESGVIVHPAAIGQCSETGRKVRRSLLAIDDLTGKPVLRRLTDSCEVTGVRTLAKNLAFCRRSGKKGLSNLFGYSDLSGEPGLADLLQQCAVTGRRLFPDELVTLSDGRRVGRDRLFCCPGCGKMTDCGEVFQCRCCKQFFCAEEEENSLCSYCRTLLINHQGQPLPDEASEALRLHCPPLRRGRYVLAHSLIFIVGRGAIWLPGRKPTLLVFKREGNTLRESFEGTPLFIRTVTRDIYCL
ncbi:MAG: SNF2-related protein [Bacillota bacterium]